MRTPNPSPPPTGAVITAAGAVTACGTSVAGLFEDLLDGRRPFTTQGVPLVANPLPAARPQRGTADDSDPEVFAGHVRTPLDLTDLAGARAARAMSRDARLLLYAAHTAGVRETVDPDRTGVVLGTLRAGRNEYLAIHNACQGAGGPVNPVWGPQSGYNAPAAQLSIHLPARGPNLTLSSGATAGLDAVAVGVQQVTSGICDTVVAAGLDTLTPALPGTTGADTPTVPQGEAAAVVMLRGTSATEPHLARVLGTGQATAEPAGTGPDAARALAGAAEEAVLDALRTADRLAADVGCAVTVTGGDVVAGTAVRAALHAAFGPKLPVCDPTAATGLSGGADGAVAVVVAVEALARGVVPAAPDQGGAPAAPIGPLALCLGVDRGGSATAVLVGPPAPHPGEAV